MDPERPSVWYVLTLELPAGEADALADWVRGALGREPVVVEKQDTRDSWIEVYFEDEIAARLAGEAARGVARLTVVSVRRCEDRDWQTFWRHHFKRRDIGRRLAVVPAWEARGQGGGRIEILIEPGLSFGTGDHFTTRFCLELIDEAFTRNPPPRSFLDVGAGSGILAIAAARLGAARVVGIENDPVALESARANLELNGVQSIVKLVQGDIAQGWEPEKYDMVCANLTTGLLIETAPVLCRLAAQHLVLSGIPDREGDLVADAFIAFGARETVRDSDGEWCGLMLSME